MNEENKTTFLNERLVGDCVIRLFNLWLWEAYPMYFSTFNSTKHVLSTFSMCQILLTTWDKKRRRMSVPKSVTGLFDSALEQKSIKYSYIRVPNTYIWQPKESFSVRVKMLVQMNVTWDFTKQDCCGQWTICSLTFWDWLDQMCREKSSPLRSSFILKTRFISEREGEKEERASHVNSRPLQIS